MTLYGRMKNHSTHRRCPAAVPEIRLPVQRTGGLLGVPRLVGGDPHLDLSSSLHLAAWSTLAEEGEKRA